MPPPRPKRKSALPYPHKAKTPKSCDVSTDQTTTDERRAADYGARVNQLASPNFAEVYRFLSRLFDPSSNTGIEDLRKMKPLDRQTLGFLFDNLTFNLQSSRMWDEQMQNVSLGKPSLVNQTHVDGTVSYRRGSATAKMEEVAEGGGV